MKIFYGTLDNNVDVTSHVPIDSETSEMLIPAGDEERAKIFGDPAYGEEKFVFLRLNGKERVISRNEQYVIGELSKVYSQSKKRVYFGSVEKRIDVTERVEALYNGDTDQIPANPEERAKIFGDPHFGVVKDIFLAEGNFAVFYGSVDAGKIIDISDKLTGGVFDFPASDEERTQLFGDPCFGFQKAIFFPHLDRVLTVGETAIYDVKNGKLRESVLAPLHRRLKFSCGSLKEEFVEQMLAVKYLQEDDIVLELGGNIGRNSCVIASILADSRNLTVLEPDSFAFMILNRNRDDNEFLFRTINAALSNSPLYLSGSGTAQSTSTTVTPRKINTITRNELPNNFTALVADCEGALKQIVEDYPSFFEPFRIVIVENDYASVEDYGVVESALVRSKFKPVETQSINLDRPCAKYFYQVWIKV